MNTSTAHEPYPANANAPGPVVVVLPYCDDRVLMQLRDEKPDIPFPGHWGFFGGSVDNDKHPDDSAHRELHEELGLRAPDMASLSVTRIHDLDNLVSYAYSFQLDIPVDRIDLQEGMDLGLFSLPDVLTGKLFSQRFNRYFPVVQSEYIGRTISKVLSH